MAQTTTNIGQRDVDLYLMGTSAEGQLDMDLSDGGAVVAGPVAAAQKFLAVLLCRKGSDPIDADYGTSFVGMATSGRLRNQPIAEMVLMDSIQDALTQLRTVREDDSPLDEEVAKVDIESVSVAVDSLDVELTLTTMAGTTTTFLVPVRLG